MKDSLVIIPFDLSWEHTADYAHQTARILAKQNKVICFMQKEELSLKELLSFSKKQLFWRKESENLFFYYPLQFIPFRRFRTIEEINMFLNIAILNFFVFFQFIHSIPHKKILWIFYPGHVPMVRYFGSSCIPIYDCVDYHIGSISDLKSKYTIRKWEDELIKSCKYFFVNSHTLKQIHKNTSKDIYIVPQGFRLESFQKFVKPKKVLLPIGKPIIGYVGGINLRLNFDLLIRLISKTPQYRYVFVGPIQKNDVTYYQRHTRLLIDALFSLPNVTYINSISKDEIPNVISQFTIAMIPYDVDNQFNKYCFPMKVFEYFYIGKPVIATPIEELKRYPRFIKIGQTPEEWEKHISSLLSFPWSALKQKEQRILAKTNSWEKKIRAILRLIH